MSTTARARLDALCERHGLPAAAADALDIVLAELAADPTAPTTVTDPRKGADVHVADSLVALDLGAVRNARRIADLGAGAGFPGLALAVALPSATVALVESVGKKCEFMTRLANAAGIGNARAVHARAEEWKEGLAVHDLVTARALAPLTALVEYAAPLLVEGGVLCAWTGTRDRVEEADGIAAARATGLELGEIVQVQPWPEVEERHLYLYVKVAPTPARFPRRPGMARKRPLQASTAA
jgi:16S rRNA (guanine527-N7)-methyltransferase